MEYRRKYVKICWGLIASLLLLRGGEYLFDYILGDKDGKITSPVLFSGLSILYKAIILFCIFLIALRILVALRILQRVSSYYTKLTEKFPEFSETTFHIGIFLLAIIVYYIQSYAVPMFLGRDYTSYLIYYFDYWSKEPVYHLLMVRRTPVAPFVLGFLLQYGGSRLLELFMAICYSFSITAVYNIGLLWSRKIGISSAIILLLYPSYAYLYHQFSSDALFALGFIGWCLYVAKTYSSPSLTKFVINGFLVVLVILIRPSGQPILLFTLFAFFLPNITFYKRIRYSIAFLVPCGTLLMLWTVHNYIRYDDLTIARGSGTAPFYRVFIHDKIVRPDNGKYSRELSEVIKAELLPKEPYKSYGITLEKFYFSKRNRRMYEDLVGLSDRIWGWDTDYRILKLVAREAIKRYPSIYIKNTLRNYYRGLYEHLYLRVPYRQENFIGPEKPKALNEKGLPVPSEGEEIPRSYLHFMASSPDNRMAPDPNSVELKYPLKQQERLQVLENKIRHSIPSLPVRDGNEKLVHFFNKTILSSFPRMFYWILFSVLGFAFFTDIRKTVFIFYLFVAFVTLTIIYLLINPLPYYRIPFDPLFIIGGVVAFRRLITYGMKLVD